MALFARVLIERTSGYIHGHMNYADEILQLIDLKMFHRLLND